MREEYRGTDDDYDDDDADLHIIAGHVSKTAGFGVFTAKIFKWRPRGKWGETGEKGEKP